MQRIVTLLPLGSFTALHTNDTLGITGVMICFAQEVCYLLVLLAFNSIQFQFNSIQFLFRQSCTIEYNIIIMLSAQVIPSEHAWNESTSDIAEDSRDVL